MSASVVLAAGNPGPVNDGERRVLNRLAEQLPDNFELHPNLQIAVDHGGMVEADLIVFGPDCMWVVEVKDLAGELHVGQHEFIVNGEPRAHPVASTRLKAQKIKSRLAGNPELTRAWIQPLVVLARTPRTLRIDPAMTKFVTSIDRAPEIVGDPTTIGMLRDRLPDRTRSLAKARLALDSSARSPRSRFGAYVAEELLTRNGPLAWWRARHEVFATEVLLEVMRFDALADNDIKARRREALLRAARVGRLLGPHPNLLAPETAFTAGDGSLVVVHPISPHPSLAEIDVDGLDGDSKRRTVGGVARLLEHCARQGVAHRTIGPGVIHVAPNGYTRVTGFSHAKVERTKAATIAPADWASLGTEFWAAPEHAGGDVGLAADWYALGQLIRFLWPDRPPSSLAGAADSLTAPNPTSRQPTPGDVAALAMPPAATRNEPGSGASLDGRFILDRQLGRGAHARVWSATDTVTNHRVAVKLYGSNDAGDQLLREYDALLDLDHPAIVRARDATQLDGRWALITELLDGPSLRAVILDRGSVPSTEAIPTILRLLDGLQTFHPDMSRILRLSAETNMDDSAADQLASLRRRGFAHLDVKPENVLLVDGRGPVLVDFGLAAGPGDGVSGGSVAYRPPDVAADGSDPDIDLFAVGVMLHELITGQHPYEDRDPVTGAFMPSIAVDDPLAEIIGRACAPERAERFVSAREFIDALAALAIEAAPLGAPATDIVERLRHIEDAITAHRWEDALAMCDGSWASIRDRIERRRALDEEAVSTEPILEAHGVSLTYLGSREFTTATDTGGNEAGPGMVGTYLVRGPAGETIELLNYRCVDGPIWVQGGDTFQTGRPLDRLGHGLRLGAAVDDDRLVIELRLARIVNDDKWSNLYKASIDEITTAAKLDVVATLKRFGGDEFGTRAEVRGEDGPRRNYACVVGQRDATHLPVVAHFLTRVLPLVFSTT